MSYQAQVGERVRVVKCSLEGTKHVGMFGTVDDVFDGRTFNLNLDNADGCAAFEVAPVFVVGQPVTEEMGEPPVGSVVSDDAGDDLFRHDEKGWLREDSQRYWNWGDILTSGPTTLASLPDAQPTEPGRSTMPEPEGKVSPSLTDALNKAAQILALSSADNSAEHDRAALWALFLGWSNEAELEQIGKRWGWTVGQLNEIRAMRQVIHEVQTGSLARRPGSPAPQPQTREVPLSELKPGDIITGTVVAGERQEGGLYFETCLPIEDIATGYLHNVTVTRKVEPLPARPGAVGVATVRGVPNVRVFRNPYNFTTATPVVGAWIFDEGDITDYQPLLDGEDS
jgi:hypothetical protein